MRVSTKGILIPALLAMTMTTASAAQECITTLPAKRDVHWYYYVRKSDGAHCWYPGSQSARAVSQDIGSREPRQRLQSNLVKPGLATEPRPLRKAMNARADTFINSNASEQEPATPETPAEVVGTRWPAATLSPDRSTARREVQQQQREQ